MRSNSPAPMRTNRREPNVEDSASRSQRSSAPGKKSRATRTGRVALQLSTYAEDSGDSSDGYLTGRRLELFAGLVAVENVDGDAAFGGRAHDRSQRLRDAAAAADDFPKIFRIDDEFDNRLRLFVDEKLDRDCFRVSARACEPRNPRVRSRAGGRPRDRSRRASGLRSRRSRRGLRSSMSLAVGRLRRRPSLVGRRASRRGSSRPLRGIVARLRFVDDRFAKEAELVVEGAHDARFLALRLAFRRRNRAAFHDALFGKQTTHGFGRLRAFGEPLPAFSSSTTTVCGSVRGL